MKLGCAFRSWPSVTYLTYLPQAWLTLDTHKNWLCSHMCSPYFNNKSDFPSVLSSRKSENHPWHPMTQVLFTSDLRVLEASVAKGLQLNLQTLALHPLFTQLLQRSVGVWVSKGRQAAPHPGAAPSWRKLATSWRSLPSSSGSAVASCCAMMGELIEDTWQGDKMG